MSRLINTSTSAISRKDADHFQAYIEIQDLQLHMGIMSLSVRRTGSENITARDASCLYFTVDQFGGLLEQETSGNFWALTTFLCAYS